MLIKTSKQIILIISNPVIKVLMSCREIIIQLVVFICLQYAGVRLRYNPREP